MTMTPQTAAREMGRLAKPYVHGAFATPTASDLAELMKRGGWHEHDGVLYTTAWMRRESKRTDWSGRIYTIPADTQVVSHLVAEPGAKLPDLRGYGRVYAYAEDKNVAQQLSSQGREVCAVKISASSEIVNCWGRTGSEHEYERHDYATLTRLADPGGDIRAAAREAARLSGWDDDFPFYSDGSWSALSLRGFKADDPAWGIKPAEMGKKWKQEHPETLGWSCGWTVLAEQCPAIVSVVNSVAMSGNLERVRLLRMAAPAPGKVSRLARHTDITDRAAGTRNGQVMRFHIPLITDPLSLMIAWDLRGNQMRQHLGTGEMWYLDARKPHAVEHGGPIDRIHLVIDVIASDAARRMVTRGREATPRPGEQPRAAVTR